MQTISVIGVDLAKKVFQIHGNDQSGKTVIKKQLSRKKLMEFIVNLPPCLIGMESCGSSNYWAREFQKHGHTVRQIPPQFVKPFVKSNKNDAADAEAIAEAVVRPNMRFVPIKQKEHHDIQTIHRVRTRLVRNRVALTNELHGLLSEYGIVLPLLRKKMLENLAEVLSPESEVIGVQTKAVLLEVVKELSDIEERIELCDDSLSTYSKSNEVCRRILEIPGIGVITATGIVASVPDAKAFKNGRQFSAWLGLVPKQHSSGGKDKLLGISKRGDVHLRTLLIHGGRAVVRSAIQKEKTDSIGLWAREKERLRGANRAAVAVANKNARIIWALMARGESFKVVH